MEKETKDLATQETIQPERIVVVDNSEFSAYLDSAKFDHLWRVANVFSRSDIVPDQYRGKPENCMISLAMAVRVGIDPMMMMQNSYIVHGRPGIEAKLAIALINSSGTFEGPLEYKYSGNGMERACTAYATSKTNGGVCEQTVTMKIAQAEGWYDKKGSKWKTMPDLMLAYRSAMFLARLYCPEVLMGMQTAEELHDVGELSNAGKKPAKSKKKESTAIADKFKKQESKPDETKQDETPAEQDEEQHKTPETWVEKLKAIVEDKEYKESIQAILKEKRTTPESLRTEDEEVASIVYTKIMEQKGFEEAEINELIDEKEEEYF